MNALVIGAAGFLGLNLVDAMLARGLRPVCGRRRRENVIPLRSRKVPMAICELDERQTLVEAMRGHDVVFHMAGHYPRWSLFPDEAIGTGVRHMVNTLEAAVEAGVPRLVYLSSTATVAPNPDGGPSDESHVYPDFPNIGAYHDTKWAMEDLAAREDRLEVRTGVVAGCLGPWDLRVGTSALLVAMARGEDAPHPDGVINLIDSRDAGEGLLRLGLAGDAPRRVILSGSTQQMHPLLERLAVRYGVAAPSAPLSAAAAKAEANAQELRASQGGPRAMLSREITDLIVHGPPVDTTLAETALGMVWRPLPETLDAYDTWARRMKILPPPPEARS